MQRFEFVFVGLEGTVNLRYSAVTIIGLLREIARCDNAMLDWKVLVRKSSTWINRLVECNSLRKAIEMVYATILPNVYLGGVPQFNEGLFCNCNRYCRSDGVGCITEGRHRCLKDEMEQRPILCYNTDVCLNVPNIIICDILPFYPDDSVMMLSSGHCFFQRIGIVTILSSNELFKLPCCLKVGTKRPDIAFQGGSTCVIACPVAVKRICVREKMSSLERTCLICSMLRIQID